jgi:hypothetical protein
LVGFTTAALFSCQFAFPYLAAGRTPDPAVVVFFMKRQPPADPPFRVIDCCPQQPPHLGQFRIGPSLVVQVRSVIFLPRAAR